MMKVGSTAQTGVLIPGPGALKLFPLQSNLIPLTPEQQELISKAKKYATEQSLKSILQKQATVTSQPQQPAPHQQKTLQRHQALVLMCRVYVGSISFELKEETIKAAFSPYGAIKSTNMSWDQVTMKHKGFAFVEYELPEAAQLALEHMNGIQLGGRQIKVGRPSNLPQAAPIIQQIQEECKAKNRIYVSNVHPDLSETELPALFDPFGKVLTCRLALAPNVENPPHRGYGFIEFDSEAAAIEALTMDNFDLGGQTLHVCRATTPAENVSLYGTLESSEMSSQTLMTTNADEDIQLQLERTNKEQNDGDDFDQADPVIRETDDTQEKSEFNQQTTSSHNNLSTNGHDSDSSPSNILVLRNMVTADDDLDDSLQLDVYDECSKYGQLLQVMIYVEKMPNDESTITSTDAVKIFLKYKDNIASRKAREALNGRFFGGREVSAEHYDQTRYRLSDYSQ